MQKILVIEDEPNISKNIKQILDLSDFYTLTASDGLEGLQLAKEEKPDLILCDVMMPNLDGYGVLKQLRKDHDTEGVPFIFLTAKSDRPDFRKGMELGADDYLTKPFTPDELLAAVETRLEKQAKITEHTQDKIKELSLRIQKALPHELYTPLNGMILSATLLNEYAESMSVEEIKEMAQSLLESSRKLHGISEKFVLYTYLELTANDPKKLKAIRNANHRCFTPNVLPSIAELQAQTWRRKHDLILELEDAVINMSESDFQKIVIELTDNAFKFSEEGDQVKVLTKISQGEFNLLIIDHGRGMTSEQIEEIGAFMPFNKDLYVQEGCGLGLAIVKKIVEIYGGKLIIESFINRQTIVHVILPLAE
jgi:CheY-like chemotaxis protein/anti-sigma regulatory factor (Ser/Thr protein kinase)